MASSGIEGFDSTLGGGYPIPSAVLVEGPVGSAKEVVLYSFIRNSGLPDRCIVVTKSGVSEVVRDAKAKGVELAEGVTWVAARGAEIRVELENLASLSSAVKEVLGKTGGIRIRLAFDLLSSLLMRNSPEAVYRFLDQLIAEVKRYDAVLLATIEPGMHPEPVLASIEHLFDGVLVVEPAQGLPPKIRIKKMMGLALPSNEALLPSREGKPKEAIAGEGRRLAAIMFTDIVGYTAITQRDESRAMEILDWHNSLLRPIFQARHGREVKTIGDAFLLEFSSALEALQCAIEVQETVSKHDKPTTIEAGKLRLRIGIHLGDVIIRGDDVFGDAVNIASRIQPLAEPGGICVSDQVYSQVRNKIHYEMVKIEQVKLKNVSQPVDVYHVYLPWEARPKVPVSAPEKDAVPLTRRLAILPLANLTQDSQDDYFADGMTDELITSLSNVKDLRVIARSSVIKYRGTTKGITEIASELHVGCVVEGSIRKQGNKVRVHIMMIDGKSEEHLFATTLDRDLQDIFAVQSDIAGLVSKAVKAKIRSIEKERIRKKPTESMDAYRLYLKGRFVLYKRTKESMEEAARLFAQATSIDPFYAKAYAGLADANLLLGSYGYLDAKQAYSTAKEHVSKALELDEGLAEAHASLGFLLETYYYDFAAARKEFERAISLSPSYAQARHWFGLNLAIFGEIEAAAAQVEKALESDPLSSQIATVLGGLYVYLGRNDEALFQWNKALMSSSDSVPVYLNRAMYYAKEGKHAEAMSDINKALELTSGAPVVKCILGYVYVALGEVQAAQKVLDEVTTIASKEYVSPWYIGMVHAVLGNKDEFFHWAEMAIQDRSAEVESLVNPDALFDSVRADPRYDEILRKVGVRLNLRPKEAAGPN